MPQQVGLVGVIGFILQFAILFFQEYLKQSSASAQEATAAQKAQLTYDGIAAAVLVKMKAANQLEKKTDDGLQDAMDGALKGPSSAASAPASPVQQTTSSTPPGSPTK